MALAEEAVKAFADDRRPEELAETYQVRVARQWLHEGKDVEVQARRKYGHWGWTRITGLRVDSRNGWLMGRTRASGQWLLVSVNGNNAESLFRRRTG